MSDANSQEMLRELRIMRGIMVASLLRSMDGGTQKETIALLSNAGIGPTEIAEILNTTPGTVNVALVGLRKARKARSASKADKVSSENVH